MRLLFLVTVAALAIGTVGAGGPARAASTVGVHGNNFFSNCLFSHTNNDDPIVYPGRPGVSHLHTFFGNKSTKAGSTLASLSSAISTCKVKADRAAYWVPTLLDDGREVRPSKASFYYVVRGYDQMQAFPHGLRMIAGDSHALLPQAAAVTFWTCGAPAVRLATSSTVPTCPLVKTRMGGSVQSFVQLEINFPDCWDGTHLDSPDHRSHMAYSVDFRCPASHSVKVPRIRTIIRYPISDGSGVILSSGGQFSAHADFINAWDEDALAKLVETCFRDLPCKPAH